MYVEKGFLNKLYIQLNCSTQSMYLLKKILSHLVDNNSID